MNAWCLDGRGMIWRETLPVTPEAVFDARTQVIAECLAGVSAVTIALALLRNGLPPLQTGVAVATCWVVVIVQVLAIAMTWSMRSPYGVDLSSPRATPAPHGAMAGYAGRLSLSTTVTGMLFTGLAAVPWVWAAATVRRALPGLVDQAPAPGPASLAGARRPGAGRADGGCGLRSVRTSAGGG